MAIYDDRLEIDNPGVLLSGLTLADIKQGNSKLRNRVIGRVLKELRYIEQWGSGILNAIGECKTMGLPEPVFEEFAFRFRATISLVPEQEPELDEVTHKIRAALLTSAGKSSGLSSQQIAEKVGLSTRAIRARMTALAQRGLAGYSRRPQAADRQHNVYKPRNGLSFDFTTRIRSQCLAGVAGCVVVAAVVCSIDIIEVPASRGSQPTSLASA